MMAEQLPAWMRAIGGATGISPLVGALQDVPADKWQRLAEMAPLIIGALQPGSPEAGAMMQGYLQSKQALDTQQRESQQRNLQTRNILSQLEQRRQQMALAEEQNQRTNLTGFLAQGRPIVESVIGESAQELPGALLDPEATGRELETRLEALRQQFKAPAGATTALMPQNLPQISKTAVARRARRLIDDFEKTNKGLDPEDLAEMKRQMRFAPSHEFAGQTIADLEERYRAVEPAPGFTMPMPPRTAGTSPERVEQLLGRIRAATEAQDTAAVAKYTRQLEDVKASIAMTRPSATGMTPAQEFNASERLATAWTKEQSAAREMERQYGLMTTGLKRFREGDPIGGSQGILVTFQKVLDPISVVREAEYSRTPEGLALLDRLEGMYQRLKAGGAGVPERELAEIVQTGKEFLDKMRGRSAGVRRRIEAAAKKYGLDPATIFDDVLMGAPSAETAMPPPGASEQPRATAPSAPATRERVSEPLPNPTPETDAEKAERLEEELRRRRGLQ